MTIFILLSCCFALASGSPMTASVQSMAAIPCETDKDCKTQVDAYSTCRFPAGLCSTNAYEQGCLYRHGASDKIRVCNSEDGPTAAEEGLCRIADIEYSEVRLFSNDWESAIFETWILQIVLSELLNVPTTTESGVYGAKNDFYNAHSSIRFGDSDFLPAMTTAARITDCREARKDPQNYTPCAHVVSEVWHASEAAVLLKNGSAKPPLSLGVLGQEALFVPKFTGERDPTLLSYMGLQGEKNRQKLADRFLRPATWREYCAEASNSSCQVADEVAARPPQNDKEFDRYYVDDLYTGFFRRTEENDCEKWPDNCTGHVVDYPCTWTSYLDQNAYHLGMALQSNGPDARSGKYTYEEMMEVWTAANHTKSDVMMMWWYPSTLYQTYLGTDAEFLKVNLPPPMQECMKNRVLQEDQCSSNIKTRVGNASGACDEAAKPLLTITSTGFFNMIYNPLIPNPLQSPAYDAVKGFQLSSTQLGEIFSYWFNARDAREGVCQWVVDNIEYARKLIPQTKFPRSIQKDPDWGTLQCVAFGLSILAVVATLISLLTVYCRRKRLVMIFAQVEFLMLTLFGLLLVSFGATALAVPPSNRSCTTAVWFVLIGYTIFLIPLCLKISTINRLIQADGALATPQVTVPRRVLIGAVGFFGICAVIFLLAWTIVDPPQKHAAYELAPSSPTDTNFVVIQHHFCSSNQTYWIIVTLAWNSLLLGCASVLAFQSRHVRQDFNESQTLAIMIYSHFVFIILRIILLVFMPNEIDESVLTLCQSIIFSIDTLVTLIIYFLPKFLTTDETHRRASVRMVNRIFTRSQVEKLDDDSFSHESESSSPKAFEKDEGKQAECATEPIDSKAAMGLRNRRSCRNCGLDPEVRAVDVEASPSTEAMES